MPDFVKNIAMLASLLIVTAGLGGLLAATILAAWAH
jgi:hypothetical protein